MTDTPRGSAAAVTVNKIGHMVPAVVRNGVILCPECGDEMVEVGRDGDWINYECRTGKSLWDFIYRDLKAAFDRREEEGHDDSDTAVERIDEMTRESRLRQAYYDGHQDGALSVLAPALGVEPQEGHPTHQLMGRRFRIAIEWLDPVSDDHLAVARRMAERAQQRAQERL